MAIYHVYTDGACSGNPGPGGWAAVILDEKKNQLCELSGFQPATTNNRMEIQAAIAGIEQVIQLSPKPHIILYSDSSYLVHAYTQGWMRSWLKTDWKKGTVKNQDLWQHLNLLLQELRHIDWVKVKGHSDNVYNNRCDCLAVAEVARNTAPSQQQRVISKTNTNLGLAQVKEAAELGQASGANQRIDPITLNNPLSDKPSENRCLAALSNLESNASKIQQVADRFSYQVMKVRVAPVTLSSVTACVAQATFNHPTTPVHPYCLQVGDMANFWLARNARRAKPYPAPERSELVKLICSYIEHTGLPKAKELGLEFSSMVGPKS